MTIISGEDTAFGKQLAHTDKEVRDAAFERLKRYFAAKGSQLDEFDMMKIWKGLFYCFWMSDKPLVQQELAENLAKVSLGMEGDIIWMYIQCFWETLSREWMGLDRHRLDKYYLLMRRMFYYSLHSTFVRGWSDSALGRFTSVYTETVLNPTNFSSPDSLRIHVANIFVDELIRLNVEVQKSEIESKSVPVTRLLCPILFYMSRTKDVRLFKHFQENTFEPLLNQAKKTET
ncbi:hypothetical protein EV182_006413, partial [Spiromyces aspiralis]